jgi:predicted Zn-dependent peptidase
VLEQILSGGRTSIIYREMVRDKKIALGAASYATYPGGKYPSLFLFFVVPNTGHTVKRTRSRCRNHRSREKTKPDQSRCGVKTNLRAALIQKLDSNSGLASELASYQAGYGDWRKLFTELDEYNGVTAEDVQRVAQKYLLENTRTVVYTYVPAKGDAK